MWTVERAITGVSAIRNLELITYNLELMTL